MKMDELRVVVYVEELKRIYEFRKYLTLWEQSFVQSMLHKKKYTVDEPTSRKYGQQYILITFNQSCVISSIKTTIMAKIEND